MPALWPKFIPDLADDITSQQFTKPGGAGTMIGMPVPAVGANNQLGERWLVKNLFYLVELQM